MQELRLAAVSEDGTYAVLVAQGHGGRFSLPIDDRLRVVARGQFSRLAQYEIEVERPLRPKEIQDRIRAGETAEEIADAAGLPVDRVRRFEGPVLAERAYRAQEAQGATIRQPGDSGPGRRLDEVVSARLSELGTDLDGAEWDSRKLADGTWQVQLMFSAGGLPRVAEWVFDPRRKHVTPADDIAARLCLPEADLHAPREPLAEATATVTPIASRLAPVPSPEPAARAEPGLARGSMRAPAVAPAGRRASVPAAGRPGAGIPPAGRPAAGRPAMGTPTADTSTAGTPTAGAPTVGAPTAGTPTAGAPSAGAPAAGAPTAGAPTAGTPAAGEGPTPEPPPQAPPRERPARRAAGGRSRRSSVPSWDEIMFGTTRQSD